MEVGSSSPVGSSGSIGENLDELYHEAPCGYLTSLPDGTIVRVNRTFLEWTGYAELELVGRRKLQDLLTPGGRIYHETHYAPLLRMQGSVREIALDIVCADGRTLPVLVNSLLRTGDPRPTVRTVLFDATERRGYERELLRARRAAEEAEARARLLARTLQASLIPPALPEVRGLELGSSYRPAGDGTDVGGDFFDVFGLDEERWGMAIGDVEGKGAEAAAVTALARYTLRAAAVRDHRPHRVLGTLNRALVMDPVTRFCTAAYALVQPAAGDGRGATVLLASAGHPLPIRVDASGNADRVGRPGTLAGAFADGFEVEETRVDLAPGDILVLFTDGLVEARGDAGFFGDDRAVETIRRHRGETAAKVANALTAAALAFQDGFAHDDIAVVVVRVP